MKLKIIAGPSGSGKSSYVYRQVIEASIREPERNFIFIVPEQTSMQVQKDLVRMHPAHSIVNIDVLSFNRLAYRVFGETGMGNLPVIEDLGKTLILQKVMRDSQKELGPYKKVFERAGSAEKMKSLISEFMQYRVTPEDLKEISGEKGVPALLRMKLADIENVYGRYKQYLSDRYLSAEEVPEILARAIPSSRLINGAVIVLDGFTGFVPTQIPVIEQLLVHASEVTAVITADEDAGLFTPEKEGELFSLSKQMARDLLHAAARTGAEVEEPVFLDAENGRFRNNASFGFLEKNLFRYSGKI